MEIGFGEGKKVDEVGEGRMSTLLRLKLVVCELTCLVCYRI